MQQPNNYSTYHTIIRYREFYLGKTDAKLLQKIAPYFVCHGAIEKPKILRMSSLFMNPKKLVQRRFFSQQTKKQSTHKNNLLL
ncbi:hypothetical protein [Tenacibaculum maritimum]|uniref:hypothetical protein n=1 Tax=Tenacibaculum maritimum TaxID=107401 RepID=UPI00388E44A3